MPFATIDGIKTRYDVVGSGPPILMYAPGGFDATIEKWRTAGAYQRTKMLDHLAKKYQCILFDRRECGESGGRVERITWAQYVAHGKGLLDHLNIKKAHVMGGCMGCCPATAFGVMHPEMVLSLVLFWPVGAYLIIYRAERSPIEIVAVTQGSRDIPAFLRRRMH